MLKKIQSENKYYALDTETYGLGFNDHLFSLAITAGSCVEYFNFNDQPDHLGEYSACLHKKSTLEALKTLFLDETITWFIHNAKFDLQKLKLEEVELRGKIHCTEVGERLIRNDYLTYSLDACAKRRGLRKDATVDQYITKHKLYDWVRIPGKQKKEKNKKFALVPTNIMKEYAMQDALVCYQIGMSQLEEINKASL